MSMVNFRPYVPALGQSKIAGDNARSHAEAVVKKDLIIDLFDHWKGLLAEPFKGITTNGAILTDLFSLDSENAPAEKAINAARYLLDQLSAEQKVQACFNVRSELW